MISPMFWLSLPLLSMWKGIIRASGAKKSLKESSLPKYNYRRVGSKRNLHFHNWDLLVEQKKFFLIEFAVDSRTFHHTFIQILEEFP